MSSVLPLPAAGLTVLSWRLSALLWVLAFVRFPVRYLPVLTRTRVDGKHG